MNADERARLRVTTTEYTVSVLPEGHRDAYAFDVIVQRRSPGRWAVVISGKMCLSRDGTWEWEMIPSERTSEWLDAHRFDLDTALALAKAAAPLVEVNGLTAAQVAARTA